MRNCDNSTSAFLLLVRAGLWEQKVQSFDYSDIDYSTLYRLAQDQTVIGLVAGGVNHVEDVVFPKKFSLTLARDTLQIEQRNVAMNSFINRLFDKLKNENINSLLVKGQGIAQCYERPFWRASGDIDLFLNERDYYKAKQLLSGSAESVEKEDTNLLHMGMIINDRSLSWIVELHGSLRGRVLKRIDSVINDVQRDTFECNQKRSWNNNGINVNLPSVDNDVIIVFAHILQHFFYRGIGLRQICDWSRLLWTYRSSINRDLLGERLNKMGMMTEWKVFASLAVDYLGMPETAMPFYENSLRLKKKSQSVLDIIFETGNFGQNRDYSYFDKYSFVIRKIISLWRHTKDGLRLLFIFPLDSILVWGQMFGYGFRQAMVGK